MIYFGQDSDSERPGDGERKAPHRHPHPVNLRQPPAAVRVVTTGRQPEVAA